ncbi:MAG: FliH/SctL family protein [Oscillospiraceae bacterium]
MHKVLKSNNISIPNTQVRLLKYDEEVKNTCESKDKDKDKEKRFANNEELINVKKIVESTIKMAEAKADEIIKEAIIKSEEKSRFIIKEAEAKAKEIKENIFEEEAKLGYENGYKQSKTEIDNLKDNIKEKLDNMIKDQISFNETVEKDICELVLVISEKVINKKIIEDDMILKELVINAIKQKKSSKEVIVSLSKEMKVLALDIETNINEYDNGLSKLSVETKFSEGGKIMLETEDGVLDISIKTQLNNIAQLISDFI